MSIGISVNFMPLDLGCLVWCFMDRCIFFWYSMMIRVDKYLTCFWLLSSFASNIFSCRKASRSDREFFFVVFNVLVSW